MPRYALIVQYDGTDFHGWQRQKASDGGQLRTAQGALEQALRIALREAVIAQGASRTDAGVHAMGQVAAFTSVGAPPVDRLALAVTSALPPDMQVVGAQEVGEEFEPISHALAKGYRYRISHGPPPEHWQNLFERRFVYRCFPRLDSALMAEAAGHFVGTHDFAAMAHAHHHRESTVRTIFRCEVIEENAHSIRIEIAGDGFLYNMVRIIAGTLVDVGRRRTPPSAIPAMLKAGDRRAAGQTLPPEGLCLMWVRYADCLTSKGFTGSG